MWADLHSLEDRWVVVGKQSLLVRHSSLAHVNLLLNGGDAGLNLVHLGGCQAHELVAVPQAGRLWSPGQVCGHNGSPTPQLVHEPDVNLLQEVLQSMKQGLRAGCSLHSIPYSPGCGASCDSSDMLA